MRLFLAYVDGIDTVFDWNLHTLVADDGFSFSMSHAEGEVATLTIERSQIGWAIMSPAHPRFVIVSESVTGDREDAVVIARGRIAGIPGDLFGKTQTIEIICAPDNLADVETDDGGVDGPLMAYARPNLADGPETNFLVDDADVDDPASYLLGRAQAYYFDPATHEVSVSDLVGGDLINLSGVHFHDGSDIPQASIDELPVSSVRLKISAPITQTAKGICEIAPVFATLADHPPEILSMSPDFMSSAEGELPDGVTVSTGAGWAVVPGQSRIKISRIMGSTAFASGRISSQLYAVAISGWDASGNPTIITQNRTQRFKEYVSMGYRSYRFDRVPMAYDYSQERLETATILVSMPIQTVPGVIDELDLGEISTIDLTTDPRAVPYEPGPYLAGDIVQLGNHIYECNESHTSLYFHQQRDGAPPFVIGAAAANWDWHPFWTEIPTIAPLRPWDPRFLDRSAGQDLIAHGICRARKALIERSRCLKITATYRWEDARAVTLKNRVRMEVPLFPGGATSAVTGKVVRVEKKWDGASGPTIQLTLAAALGTGATETTVAAGGGTYADDDYFPADYLADDVSLYGVAGDTEYTVEAEALYQPVITEFLGNPGYAVQEFRIDNQLSRQLGAAISAGMAGKDPRDAASRYPTRIGCRMIDLSSVGLVEREFIVAGQVLTSPRGIDLVAGGEP